MSEDRDSLSFTVRGRRRPAHVTIFASIGFVCALAAWSWGRLDMVLALTSMAALLCWKSWHVTTTELVVTEVKVIARGDLGLTNGEVILAWPEIRSLGHQFGGEYDPSGLFATHSWFTSTCLVPDLTEAQTWEILSCIYERFPLAPQDESGGTWSFVTERSSLLTLGLSSSLTRAAKQEKIKQDSSD